MKKIELHNYDIIIDSSFDALSEFIAAQNYSSVFVLVDEHSKEFCLPKLSAAVPHLIVIEIPSGEEHKNIATCELIWKQLIDHQADRKAILINLGGGVIGDMGGFAAATYKRGIDFIQVPTTILSQVDSSIGGKLGVDFKYGKNLIGLFQNPKLVFLYPEFLKTLPERQFVNGFAEIFKHALIQDKAQWDVLKRLNIYYADIATVIHDSLLIKKNVVELDPYEGGLRKILNFGHTIGHAIEAYSMEYDDEPLLHGEAIAIGMICEAFLSQKQCGLSENEYNEIIHVLATHFPVRDISKYDASKIMEFIKMDKKNTGDQIRFALLQGIGKCTWDIEVGQGDIARAMQSCLGQ